MSRQLVPVENLEAFISDLQRTTAMLQEVVDGMRSAKLDAIWLHVKRVEDEHCPKLAKFAGDAIGSLAQERSNRAMGRESYAIKAKEKAAKTVANRQAKRVSTRKPK